MSTARLSTSRTQIMATYERIGNLSVWWFPKDFSQSRFGEFRQSGTNSCTLISLLLANKVAREERGFLRYAGELPRKAFGVFSAAINEGNAAYSRAFGVMNRVAASKSMRYNLSVPDAMRMLRTYTSVGFQLQEWFFTHLHTDRQKEHYSRVVATQLSQIFCVGVELFRQPSVKETTRFLFAALISDSRTVCFIFEFPVALVSLFDSHQHGRGSGAVIAQSTFANISDLLYWFVRMQQDIYGSQPSLYEISFLTTNDVTLPAPRQFMEARG